MFMAIACKVGTRDPCWYGTKGFYGYIFECTYLELEPIGITL
jgi:hypothetical protein